MDNEFNAYIHQKIQELEDSFTCSYKYKLKFLDIQKSLKKLQEEDEYNYNIFKNSTHSLSLYLKNEDGFKIKAYGFGTSRYEALDAAVKAIKNQINMIVEENVSNKDRDYEINRARLIIH